MQVEPLNSMDKNAEIAAKLQALKEAYLARLPEELALLKTLVAQMLDPAQQLQALTQLNHKLHKLAGSAGSFGLPDFGKQAKQLELQTHQWLTEKNFDPGKLRVFGVAVAGLEKLLEPSTSKPLPQVSALAPETSSTLIYVLEDDPDVAEEVCASLRHFGHDVQHFDSLQKAERSILQCPPDFMICDIMFSDEARETPSAVAALQAQVEQPIPVIFVSTRNDFQAYHDAVRAGAVGYFVKPLDITRLVDCFEYYLDRHRSAPYRVLIVDDDRELAEHYRLVLNAAGIRAEVNDHPEQIFDLMTDFHPELILLDLNMPGVSGTELAQVIRLNEDWLRVPITYLSSEQDVDKRVTAMGRAGDDFLTKPLADRELVAAVSVRAARCRQLSDALDRDSLTGLLKHSRIKEQVDLELNRAQRSASPMSVVMLDLDHFKKVNDTYGHSLGDKVIKALAQLLRQRLRKTDALGRYGGEEFMLVLPRCNREEAFALIDNVRSHFGSINFHADDNQFNASLSAGIATWIPGDPRSADELIQAADLALYQAKLLGRNRVEQS